MLRGGLELPYVEQGEPDGVPVVLLHAWADSRRCFDRVTAVLPDAVHAFAFDQRGHGDAPKPAEGYGLGDFADDVGAFMDAVELDAAVLVGASSGGYVAQRFAVDNPGRTLGLALIGCPRSLHGLRPPFADDLADARRPDRWSPFGSVNSAKGWLRVRFPRRSWQCSARRTSRFRRASGAMHSRGCWPPIRRWRPVGYRCQP